MTRRPAAIYIGPNTWAQRGRTALMTAAREGRVDFVRVLIDAGADANAKHEVIHRSQFLGFYTVGFALPIMFVGMRL
jgi:ankyrin repeat protein